MKKYLFLMLLPMVIGLASCDYHDKMVETGDLPTKTTMFIADYFPGCNIVAIDKDRELGTVKGLPDGGKVDVESVLWTSVEEGLIYNITKTRDFARICKETKENRRFG